MKGLVGRFLKIKIYCTIVDTAYYMVNYYMVEITNVEKNIMFTSFIALGIFLMVHYRKVLRNTRKSNA